MKENSLLAVIAAAGIGKRYGSDLPKQYAHINGQSVIEKAINPFINSKQVSKIIIVISRDDKEIKNQSFYDDKKIQYVYGGSTRKESINNALKVAESEFEYVITHDAARPNIKEEDINDLYKDITQSKASCSFFFTPVYDLSLIHI